ncbi:putative Na+/H+ antiporter [Dechloromonas denitrificans]|uniref:putative Na+/H+ antiporter n=1 Tax=Dechloromonas denitrificans TaxID=281362 RepID=UPI001CFBB70A|nr:putative Na+/H+ antiporter [Dechloromonas denitrificans]UCV09719.1 putative Na+/H+ antiporter [Dechloromonas denitrificans]
MDAASSPEVVAAIVFALAVGHTFSTGFFARLAHLPSRHAGLWHLLSEVEVVFGFWAFVLVVTLFMLTGKADAVDYMESRNFTEPLFVFVIMVVAASRPILEFGDAAVRVLARLLPFQRSQGIFFLCLSIVPLLGSFITEPAAMTLAALMLRDGYFRHGLSRRLQYAVLGVLFVNVSIGGTLTSFGAPPVLMVAAKWEWNSAFMLSTFGWKAAVVVLVNAALLTGLFRHELAAGRGGDMAETEAEAGVPVVVILVHLAFLVGVVVFAHHPAIFMGLFLFFIGYTEAYERYQDKLILREGLLVAFFLAGLVVLGGLQQWWLQPTLMGVEPTLLYFLAIGLTAITDNAALTYLASLVDGVSAEFKYAIVAGAVTGGGLTIIANAPNPAGVAILKSGFADQSISPLGLFLGALAPTGIAILGFLLL